VAVVFDFKQSAKTAIIGGKVFASLRKSRGDFFHEYQITKLQLLARTEDIVPDPTYTAKAMAALLDRIQDGKLTRADTVLC
jgi:1-aminocyclopropane-1-carboxylate deaminase/D-cysteine desulfhydrase-like pyridoxal-dependent ACC family enzyme